MEQEFSFGASPSRRRRCRRGWCCFGVVALLAVVIIVPVVLTQNRGAGNDANNSNDFVCANATTTATTSAYSANSQPDPLTFGLWETLLPKGGAAVAGNLGVMPIHVALLPSGKVLMVSGSSWRNRDPTPTYPQFQPPNLPRNTGVFVKSDLPFADANLAEYYSIVNYNAIYDPTNNEFFRIPHPVPAPDPDQTGSFLPTDLFCSGNLHLPNGNVLFVGGTQYYTPQRTGNRATNVFDWRKETTIDWNSFNWTQSPSPQFDPWVNTGTMLRGRWYPSLLPLLDGRILIVGGFVGFDPSFPSMYPFEMNHYVEFFDWDLFNSSSENGSAWSVLDVQNLTNSPFNTPLDADVWTSAAFDCKIERQCLAYQHDSFKLYPHIYRLADGRIYFTREGDWNSLRTADAAFIRRSKFTYFMTVSGNNTSPSVSFTRGPDRPEFVTLSGTTVMDPNGPQILLLGGMRIYGGTLLPGSLDANDSRADIQSSDFVVGLANQYAGSRGTSKLEVFQLPGPTADGSWTLKDPNYLDSDRTMHYALILPTKQLLVIAGGNYDFFGPIYTPTLLTPVYLNGAFTGQYTKTPMSDHREPRLYHSSALLLPDARIIVMGGNTCRATISVNASQSIPQPFNASNPRQDPPNPSRVDLGLYFFGDGYIAKGPNVAPTENWVSEVFSPPYLFIDGDRRPSIDDIQLLVSGVPTSNITSIIGGKIFTLIHSNQTYFANLSGLPTQCSPTVSASLVIIKLGSATHGWDSGQRLYTFTFTPTLQGIEFSTPDAQSSNIAPAFYMMFYVDCRGKPSVASMIRFDDRVNEV